MGESVIPAAAAERMGLTGLPTLFEVLIEAMKKMRKRNKKRMRRREDDGEACEIRWRDEKTNTENMRGQANSSNAMSRFWTR